MNFIDKTLESFYRFVESSVFSSNFASRSGFLQLVQPHLKTAGILLLIIAANLSKGLLPIVGLIVSCIILAVASKIPLLFFLKRTILFIPFFAVVLALPALFNVVLKGDVVLHLFKVSLFGKGIDIGITSQGLYTAALLVLRITASVAYTTLLVLTTKWTDIIAVLKTFFVPEVILISLFISYRYIFLLLHYGENSLIAKKSRVFRQDNLNFSYKWLSNRIGMLLKRSLKLSQCVWLAMESRGYMPSAYTPKTQIKSSYSFVFSFCVICLIFSVMLYGKHI
ncbi:cobalt ECF transporter T component CbiQ [Hippea jasoniae]|uniref:cobalt ECF transporter T component CbiQ n=1 Tax=Hippea jasoniae TaxID=944479 RepID=UPI00055114E7|nr:cobalt ECF transporter T component CbiQ [Hippea jasoniae]